MPPQEDGSILVSGTKRLVKDWGIQGYRILGVLPSTYFPVRRHGRFRVCSRGPCGTDHPSVSRLGRVDIATAGMAFPRGTHGPDPRSTGLQGPVPHARRKASGNHSSTPESNFTCRYMANGFEFRGVANHR
jgi:hypothetical protein